jgi:hypothetical protein
MAGVETVASHPIVGDVLASWAGSLGGDAAGYRGHVYRMFNFCRGCAPRGKGGVSERGCARAGRASARGGGA